MTNKKVNHTTVDGEICEMVDGKLVCKKKKLEVYTKND